MPLVKPRDKEKREDYLERCMGDETSMEDFPSRNQRFAVCNSLWNQRNKKEESSMEDFKGKKPKDDEMMKEEPNKRDIFDNEDDARARAKEIGCVGVHSMMDNGKRIFMPCGTHAAYDEARKNHYGKPHDDEDKKPKKPKDELEEMGHYDDEDKYHKKPKKKSHTECDDDGNCQCDTEMKSVIFESEIKTTGQGVFSGYGSIFGNEDQGNDVVQKGAFTKSLNTRPASKVKMLFQHKTDEPIGVFEDIREDEKGLFVKGRLALGTQKGRETYELLKLGALDGMSIGFRADPKKQGYNENKRGVRTLKEVDLMEISLVTFPMNEEALVQSVKGNSKNIREWEDILREVGGLSRTESKIGAKALFKSLNQRDAEIKNELVSLISKVTDLLKKQ